MYLTSPAGVAVPSAVERKELQQFPVMKEVCGGFPERGEADACNIHVLGGWRESIPVPPFCISRTLCLLCPVAVKPHPLRHFNFVGVYY